MAQDPAAATDSTDSKAEAASTEEPKVEQKEAAPSTLDSIKGGFSAFGAKASQVAADIGAKASDIGAKASEAAQDLGSQANARLTMVGQLEAAHRHLAEFLNPKLEVEKQIPVQLMKDAKGIVLLSSLKASLGIGASVGSGVILAKLEDGGWSGPCSIGLLGGQMGFNVGAQKTDFVIILREDKALTLFGGKGQLKFGADASIAAGPHGRDAQLAVGANKQGYAATVSYSMAQGLYIGVALEGQGIMVREDCNTEYYGKKVTVKEVLESGGDAVENADYQAIVAMLESYGQEDAKEKENDDAVKGGDDDEAKAPL